MENGEVIKQETRSFNADNNSTFSLRSKEEADDYRYFPEPDLPPFFISEDYINTVKANMPELPAILQEKLMQVDALSLYDAAMICIDKDDVKLYETISKISGNCKATANWIIGPVRKYCNDNNLSINNFPLEAGKIAELILFTETGKIHFNTASTKLMEGMINNSNNTAEELALALNLLQENDTTAISKWVDEVILLMPDKAKEYKAGKKGLIGLFAGQVKKMSKGKADMELATKMLEERLAVGN